MAEKTSNSSSEVDFRVSVVLPAGGTGERFGCNQPKQYSLLLDKPLLLHTISTFHKLSWIDDIVLVVSPQYISYVSEIKQENELDKLTVTEGCSTRHRSIYAGIKVLCKEKELSSVVIIHDVVRPFIDEDVIKQVAVSAKIYGAAGVTRPLVSTVISTDEQNLLKESLDRTKYCGSEMPQGFVLSVIKTAYDMSDDYDFNYGTECLLLAMKYTNTRAKLISGPDNLWKVTYKKDLYAAEGLLKEKLLSTRMNFMSGCHNNTLTDMVKAACTKRFIQFMENDNIDVPCNSIVFVYTKLNLKQISENPSSTICTSSSTSIRRGLNDLIKPCVLHVYHGCKLEKDEIFSFMESMRNIDDKGTDVLTFGVLYFGGEDFTRLSDMIASLIWNRDATLSGQTFIINQSKTIQ